MWQTVDDFKYRLARRGWRSIGEGLFSEVYAKKGSDKVIKVSRMFDGWPQWITWAAKNGELGKRAPLVTSLKMITPAKGAPFYVAVMERLATTISHNGEPSLYDAVERHRNTIAAVDGWRAEDAESADWKRMVRQFFSDVPLNTDLHLGNWMVRHDGSLVLTDPVADESGDTSTYQRLKSSAWRAPQALAA